MIELSRYAFETLREDAEFALCRGRRDGEIPTILLVAPLSEHSLWEAWSGWSTNIPFEANLTRTGGVDLSPWLVVRVGQCLCLRTLAVSHSIDSWGSRWI